jgi:hypothetical protein
MLVDAFGTPKKYDRRLEDVTCSARNGPSNEI